MSIITRKGSSGGQHHQSACEQGSPSSSSEVQTPGRQPSSLSCLEAGSQEQDSS